MLTYIECNYFGKLKPNSSTFRVQPRFPIPTWRGIYLKGPKDLPKKIMLKACMGLLMMMQEKN